MHTKSLLNCGLLWCFIDVIEDPSRTNIYLFRRAALELGANFRSPRICLSSSSFLFLLAILIGSLCLYYVIMSCHDFGRVKRKGEPFKYAQNARIHIIPHMRKVSSEHLLSIETVYSIQRFCFRTENAQIRVWGSAGWSGPSLSARTNTNSTYSWKGRKTTYDLRYSVIGKLLILTKKKT